MPAARSREPKKPPKANKHDKHDVPLTKEQSDLAARWMPLLRGIVAKHARDRGDRNELTSRLQQALLRAARTYDPEKGYTFRAYATQIMKNAVIDERRALTRRREVVGLDDWKIERIANEDHQPSTARVETQDSTVPSVPERPSNAVEKAATIVATPEQTALAMLREDATYHEVAQATGLKRWRIERLAKSAKIVRVQGPRSRLTTQLASANLTRKQLQEATGLSKASIISRLRTIYRLRFAKRTRKNWQRRHYRPSRAVTYILHNMRNPIQKPIGGRPPAIPEDLWPELRQRQLDGARQQDLVRWLSTKGVVASQAAVSRTLERCAAVAPVEPSRAQRIMEAAEQMPPATDEEDVTNLRKQLRRDAFEGMDWKERHSAARLLLQIIDLKNKKAPQQVEAVVVSESPSANEEEQARAYLAIQRGAQA